MIGTLRRDIQAVNERDPAARGTLETLFLYPGLHAIWFHRAAQRLWKRNLKIPARLLSFLARFLTGVEIHPGATLGPGLLIDHGLGVVIGETAEVGTDVTLYHGVTLGGTSLAKGKRHPTLGDRVVVGAGAKILGAITIGDDCRIGANAVVVKSVPANSVVVGVPGKVMRRRTPHAPDSPPDFDHARMPDITLSAVYSLEERVEALEQSVNGHISASDDGHAHREHVWYEEDFSI